MARKRMIDPDFWVDEKLGKCTRDERLLFMGLISQSDDKGRGRANPMLVRSMVFPYDSDVTGDEVAKWLNNLNSLGLIKLYIVDNQEFYWLPNFNKHQTINRPSESKLPPPPESINDNSMNTHEIYNEHSRPIEEKRKEVKEEEKRKENESGCRDFNSEAEEVFEYYMQTFDGFFPKGLTLTKERKAKILARLKNGYSVDDIKLAITNIRRSSFHCGENEKGKVYATIEFICRNAAKLEEWMNFQPKIRGQPEKMDKLQAMYEKYRSKEGP